VEVVVVEEVSRNLGGRPEIGPAFSVRFPAVLLDRVDAAAAAEGRSRAGWLRASAEDRLANLGRGELAPFVLWLLDEQSVEHSEIARVIEKPWAYQDWLATFRRGGSVDDLEPAPAGRFAR
jgi:hypothetical protein